MISCMDECVTQYHAPISDLSLSGQTTQSVHNYSVCKYGVQLTFRHHEQVLVRDAKRLDSVERVCKHGTEVQGTPVLPQLSE